MSLHTELNRAFSALEEGVRNLAWDIANEVLSLELSSRKLGVRLRYPTPRARGTMITSDTKDNLPSSSEAVTSDMIKTVPGSKREKYLELLNEKTGMWKRADGSYFYKCLGESTDKPGHYVMQDADGYKTLTVTLVTLCSKWCHHPI